MEAVAEQIEWSRREVVTVVVVELRWGSMHGRRACEHSGGARRNQRITTVDKWGLVWLLHVFSGVVSDGGNDSGGKVELEEHAWIRVECGMKRPIYRHG